MRRKGRRDEGTEGGKSKGNHSPCLLPQIRMKSSFFTVAQKTVHRCGSAHISYPASICSSMLASVAFSLEHADFLITSSALHLHSLCLDLWVLQLVVILPMLAIFGHFLLLLLGRCCWHLVGRVQDCYKHLTVPGRASHKETFIPKGQQH